jgi:hypothetical protein
MPSRRTPPALRLEIEYLEDRVVPSASALFAPVELATLTVADPETVVPQTSDSIADPESSTRLDGTTLLSTEGEEFPLANSLKREGDALAEILDEFSWLSQAAMKDGWFFADHAGWHGIWCDDSGGWYGIWYDNSGWFGYWYEDDYGWFDVWSDGVHWYYDFGTYDTGSSWYLDDYGWYDVGWEWGATSFESGGNRGFSFVIAETPGDGLIVDHAATGLESASTTLQDALSVVVQDAGSAGTAQTIPLAPPAVDSLVEAVVDSIDGVRMDAIVAVEPVLEPTTIHFAPRDLLSAQPAERGASTSPDLVSREEAEAGDFADWPSPLAAGAIGMTMPLDVAAIEAGLRRFLERFDGLARQAAPSRLAEYGVAPWLAAAVTTACTVEIARIHYRNQRPRVGNDLDPS